MDISCFSEVLVKKKVPKARAKKFFFAKIYAIKRLCASFSYEAILTIPTQRILDREMG